VGTLGLMCGTGGRGGGIACICVASACMCVNGVLGCRGVEDFIGDAVLVVVEMKASTKWCGHLHARLVCQLIIFMNRATAVSWFVLGRAR
jgi:hypothetical protein